MSFQVLHATTHRNGVAGAGFQVAIVNDDENGRMLVIDFSVHNDDVSDAYTAVLNLDMAAQNNIYSYQQLDEHGAPIPNTGDNAWRGDVLGQEYRQAITEHAERWRDEQSARLIASEKAGTDR